MGGHGAIGKAPRGHFIFASARAIFGNLWPKHLFCDAGAIYGIDRKASHVFARTVTYPDILVLVYIYIAF